MREGNRERDGSALVGVGVVPASSAWVIGAWCRRWALGVILGAWGAPGQSASAASVEVVCLRLTFMV